MGRKMEEGLSFVNDTVLDFSSQAVCVRIESENMNRCHAEAVDCNANSLLMKSGSEKIHSGTDVFSQAGDP